MVFVLFFRFSHFERCVLFELKGNQWAMCPAGSCPMFEFLNTHQKWLSSSMKTTQEIAIHNQIAQ